ncbi:MAG: Na+/H+ antiporter subunit E [Actinomycetes bacterium]
MTAPTRSGPGARTPRRWLQAVFLLAVWCTLWGEVSWGNLLTGAVVVALTLAWCPRPDRRHRVHPLAAVRFGTTFLWLLVTSSVSIAVAVVRPTTERLRAGVVVCPLVSDDPLVATVVADAVTLTPGTLTLDVRADPPALEVHVLGLGDPDAVRADVARLERLVLGALTPIQQHAAGGGAS